MYYLPVFDEGVRLVLGTGSCLHDLDGSLSYAPCGVCLTNQNLSHDLLDKSVLYEIRGNNCLFNPQAECGYVRYWAVHDSSVFPGYVLGGVFDL